jgi:hypothetical protein
MTGDRGLNLLTWLCHGSDVQRCVAVACTRCSVRPLQPIIPMFARSTELISVAPELDLQIIPRLLSVPDVACSTGVERAMPIGSCAPSRIATSRSILGPALPCHLALYRRWAKS